MSLSHNALLEREHPAVGVEGEGEVVLDAEAEEDVLQRRAPGLVRLGEGALPISYLISFSILEIVVHCVPIVRLMKCPH